METPPLDSRQETATSKSTEEIFDRSAVRVNPYGATHGLAA